MVCVCVCVCVDYERNSSERRMLLRYQTELQTSIDCNEDGGENARDGQ